ncbi:arginyltransferase [Hydromonas duriensis]|uniref:Aspartate/glutamate leucyltransferase n=1 Tax=Hydromonas duriensis TaxID=1527608 RepID=A0A4R6YB87_9BURK|nr:arginyltransferase [Hydromonas duriensis]TDR32850.1 arginine-tRNA-protein transferase [Hydromonas duriensis]
MNTNDHQYFSQIQLYETDEYPCSYLPERFARSQVVASANTVNAHNYQSLLDQGFRRSGLFVYRSKCKDCNACQSLRIPVEQFAPNRSQRRAKKQWAKLITDVHELKFSREHFDLYQRYQHDRHSEPHQITQNNEEQYQEFLLKSQVNSVLVEFRDPEANHRLVMVSAIDRTASALSAVYTFFETDPTYSGLGTFNVLWQIDWAKRLGLSYLYLGYWIEDSQKMAYKSKFAPSEILYSGDWRPLQPLTPL